MKEPNIMGFSLCDFIGIVAIGLPLLIITAPIWIFMLICGVDIKKWIMEED